MRVGDEVYLQQTVLREAAGLCDVRDCACVSSFSSFESVVAPPTCINFHFLTAKRGVAWRGVAWWAKWCCVLPSC